jgi:hypothetical protein
MRGKEEGSKQEDINIPEKIKDMEVNVPHI